jgi:hypothetical protein
MYYSPLLMLWHTVILLSVLGSPVFLACRPRGDIVVEFVYE